MPNCCVLGRRNMQAGSVARKKPLGCMNMMKLGPNDLTTAAILRSEPSRQTRPSSEVKLLV